MIRIGNQLTARSAPSRGKAPRKPYGSGALASALALLGAALVVSCVSESRPAPAPGPGPYAGPAPGPYGGPPPGSQACGMFMFQQPECEAAFDQGCCAQQQQCASDPGCQRIIQCWNACEARRATEGCNCFSNCAPQGYQTPGIQLFGHVTDCTKGLQYPHDSCETGC